MFKIIIIFSLILLSFFACSQSSEKITFNEEKNVQNSKLLGMWYVVEDSTTKIEFTSDGIYNEYSKKEGKQEFKFLENDHGTWVDKDYGRMKYSIRKKGDTLNVVLTGEKNNEFYAKRIYFIDGDNCLTEIIYKKGIKEGIDINNHIKVVNRYYKENIKESCSVNAPRYVFHLSKDFTTPKIVYMIFGQLEGITGQINQKEKSISYQIPNTNTLKIKELENVKSFAWELLDFYMEQEDGTLKKMKVLYADDIIYFKGNSYGQKIELDYDINQVVVFASSRFNARRTFLYEIFGEEVEGNELSFEVVLLKERLEEWGIDLNYVEYPKQK